MHNSTIQFVVLGADVLQGAPALSSPDANYGCVRIDPYEEIVADDTAMDAAGTLWEHDFVDTGGDSRSEYRYYVEVVADGRQFFVARTTNFVQSSCLVLGRYTTSYDIEQRYGIEELVRWSGNAAQEEPIQFAYRLQSFITDAEAWLDDEISCVYTVDPDNVPAKIKDLATDVAALRLYEAKGLVDKGVEGYPEHRLSYVAKRLKVELDKIRWGQVRFADDDLGRGPVVADE